MSQKIKVTFTSTARMGKICRFSNVERGMIVGARWVGMSISVNADPGYSVS